MDKPGRHGSGGLRLDFAHASVYVPACAVIVFDDSCRLKKLSLTGSELSEWVV